MALNLLSNSQTFFLSDRVRQSFLKISSYLQKYAANVTSSSGLYLNSPNELIIEPWEKESELPWLLSLEHFSKSFEKQFSCHSKSSQCCFLSLSMSDYVFCFFSPEYFLEFFMSWLCCFSNLSLSLSMSWLLFFKSFLKSFHVLTMPFFFCWFNNSNIKPFESSMFFFLWREKRRENCCLRIFVFLKTWWTFLCLCL